MISIIYLINNLLYTNQLSNSTNTGDFHTTINVQNMQGGGQQKSINKDDVHNFANKK
jgi:hypothetical protein